MSHSLSSADLQLIVRACREVRLLADAIQQEGFLDLAARQLGGDRRAWTPVNMALISMGINLRAEDLALVNLPPAPQEVIQRAQAIYEQWSKNYAQPHSLAEAGWLALALREIRRASGNWNEVLRFINQSGQFSARGIEETTHNINRKFPDYSTWAGILVCLHGMVPDGDALVRGLLGRKVTSPNYEWIEAILFTYSLTLEEQTQHLVILFNQLPSSQQLIWLRRLSYEGRKHLLQKIASLFLEESSSRLSTDFLGLKQTEINAWAEEGDLEVRYKRLYELERLAVLNYYSGQPAQALNLLQTARKLYQLGLAGIDMQLLGHKENLDREDLDQELIQVLKLTPRLRGELALNGEVSQKLIPALLENNGSFWGREEVSDGKEPSADACEPLMRLRQSKLIADSGDIPLAREIARKICSMWCDAAEKTPDSHAPRFILEWDPIPFLNIFKELGLHAEAIRFAEACLLIRPNDLALLEAYQQILQTNGMWEKGLQVTRSMILDDANNPDWHRRLAVIYAGMKDYGKTLQERQIVMHLASEPEIDDWLALASAAELNNNSAMVVSACQEILKHDADHGGANALVGRALVRMGKTDEAIEYLSRATILAPEEPLPWQTLAEVYEQKGDLQKSLEIARAAVLAAPESSELHYMLGKKLSVMGKAADALQYLKEAYRISPHNESITQALGSELHRAGNLHESCQVLQDGCDKWPDNLDILMEYGQACLGLGNLDAALATYEKAISLSPKRSDCVNQYAETLLAVTASSSNPKEAPRYGLALQRARKLLEEQVVENGGPQSKTQFLLAETLRTLGEFALANEMYKLLLDANKKDRPDWYWKVQAGYGISALQLSMNQEALVALREASQEQSQNIGLMRHVVEALLANRLEKEAADTARFTLRLAPNNVELLAWFADVMAKLGMSDEAAQALECSLQLDPTNSGNWLKLIEVYLRAGENSAARTALQKFLIYGSEDANTLHEIAIACVRLSDYSQAIDCLKRAERLNASNPKDLWVELAYLHEKTGQLERTMDYLQKLDKSFPDDPVRLVYQADILLRTGRTQAAKACLEQAAGLWGGIDDRTGTTFLASWRNLVDRGFANSNWFEAIASPAAIHVRFAKINHQTGNWEEMLNHVENALRISSKDIHMRYDAALCVASALKFERSLKIVDGAFNSVNQNQSEIPDEILIELISLRAELMLETGRYDEASLVIQQGLGIAKDSARILALKARDLSRKGMQLDAEKTMRKVIELQPQYTSWFAQALLETGRFDEALAIFADTSTRLEQCNEQNCPENDLTGWSSCGANDPRAQFEYGRALITCAEQAILRSELRITGHLPSPDCLDDIHYASMIQALNKAYNATKYPAVESWLARGKLAYHPSAAAALELANLTPGREEVPALVMGLRRLNRTGNALQWSQKFPDDPNCLLQMALCTLKFDVANGAQNMKRAAEMRPCDPIFQAGYAFVSAQSQSDGGQETALRRLNLACEIWADEPEWHFWAAELASGIREEADILSHLERAFVLRPQWFDAAFSLGKAYLANGQNELAEEVLDRATELSPSRSDVWYALAIAHRKTNHLSEALICAERSAGLDRNATAPIMLCGEIALALGKISEAAGFAQAAVERDKKDVGAVLFLSEVLEAQSSPVKALSIVDDALKGLPNNLPLQVKRARLGWQVKGAKTALPMIEEILRQYPNEFQAVSLMAEVQYESGNLEQAERLASHALELQPDDASLMFLLGRIHHANGQLDLAVRYLTDVIRRKPDRLDAFLELGSTYQDRREYKKAIGIYQRAQVLAPANYRPYFELANVLKEIKDYPKAEEMLKRAAELSPTDINIRKQLSAVMALNLIQNTPIHKNHSHHSPEGEEVKRQL